MIQLLPLTTALLLLLAAPSPDMESEQEADNQTEPPGGETTTLQLLQKMASGEIK